MLKQAINLQTVRVLINHANGWQISSTFSVSFASKLRKLKRLGKIKKTVPRDLIKHPWAVYAKQAFGSPESVVEYLGRYTHRVAVSNARIVEVTGTHEAFAWCDRKHDHAKRTETLPGGGVP